ncbi:beta-ketoacyl synthase N-terminal-like domain-containing protein [Chryseobacterium cucumeris]
MERTSIKKDIAIIGISCKFSKADNPKEFWENIKNGVEFNQFYTDQELKELGIDSMVIKDPSFVKSKTYVSGFDSFDFQFFGYTRDEANIMDPQIRILHEQVWLALEDAGYNPFSYKDKIGLYLSASDNFNWIAHSLSQPNKNVDPFYQSFITNKNNLSTIISYNLNLKGPSYSIDTACSSSLSALHVAARNLLLKECSIAVTGGINVKTSKNIGYFYKDGMINSKDGYCRTFDKDSTGTFASEGAAVVVLKRLEDAIKDRDNIYAVIKSSASNNDGKRKVGYTAPSVAGQSDCIKMAHKIANVPSSTISYIEAHGTGTALGDPIEIEALNKAFNYDKTFTCAIGSLKSNVGHLNYASGIAGLVKTTLALQNKMIPPSLHFKSANPNINFEGGPFYVNTELKKWDNNNSHPLRAGVSSFGIGGTNTHVILEQFENSSSEIKSKPYQIISYSAKNPKSLNDYSQKLKEFVSNEDVNLADLAYTLQSGRESFLFKKFFICENKEELIQGMDSLKSDTNIPTFKANRKTVFLFPGQGSQYYKMGIDLYHNEFDFKEVMDAGFGALLEITGTDYSEIIGYRNSEKQINGLINNTRYTQPILFLFEYALAQVLIKWGVQPDIMIGHSLGEYVAACIAGVFSFKDALSLVVKRSDLMSRVKEGKMLAIGLPISDILEFLPEELSVAAVNSDDSCVVSGDTESVEDFITKLEVKDIGFSTLKTSHAFHSQMMDEMLDAYINELERIEFSKPMYAFVSNLTGKLISDHEATSKEYWAKHLRKTVNFKDGADFILQNAHNIFIEVGPGKILSSFIKQSKVYSDNNSIVHLVRHFNEEINDSKKFTYGIAELWRQGKSINWDQYYATEARYKISAPTYCFDKNKLDFTVDPFQHLGKMGILNDENLNHWYYLPKWKRSSFNKNEEHNVNQNYLVFSDQGNLMNSIEEQLQKDEVSLIKVLQGADFNKNDDFTFTVNPSFEDNFKLLFQEIKQQKIQINQIIFNWNFKDYSQESLLDIFSKINNLSKCLITHFPGQIKKITVLSDLGQNVLGDEKSNIAMLTSLKQFNILAQENPSLFSCSIDIMQEENHPTILSRISDELKYNYSEQSVAYRNKNRWVEFYENIEIDNYINKNRLQKNKNYLITGGLGKVGQILTDYLIDNYQSKIIVIGRKEIPSEDLWDTILEIGAENENMVKNIEYLQNARRNNKPIYYYSSDVSEYDSFQKTINRIEREHGSISGIIHAAGNNDIKTFKAIDDLNRDIALKQFNPKINGTLNIYRISRERSLDFVWITSSLSTILGGLTYGAYAIANTFIDAFCNNKKEELKNWLCVNLDGINQDKISNNKLIELFEKTLQVDDCHQIIISSQNLNLVKTNKDKDKIEKEDNVEIYTVDRKCLEDEYVAPVSEIEIELCNMLELFYGLNKIGVLDDFFELGGDSLKAMTFIKRVNKLFNVDLNIKDLYSSPNVKKLAEQIEVMLRLITIQNKPTGKNTIII